MHFGVFRCHLLGHDGALMGRAKVRHLGGLVEVDRICHKILVGGQCARESYQLGGVATSLDWVEVADLFWNINHTYNLKYDKLDDQGSEMIGS